MKEEIQIFFGSSRTKTENIHNSILFALNFFHSQTELSRIDAQKVSWNSDTA